MLKKTACCTGVLEITKLFDIVVNDIKEKNLLVVGGCSFKPNSCKRNSVYLNQGISPKAFLRGCLFQSINEKVTTCTDCWARGWLECVNSPPTDGLIYRERPIKNNAFIR